MPTTEWNETKTKVQQSIGTGPQSTNGSVPTGKPAFFSNKLILQHKIKNK